MSSKEQSENYWGMIELHQEHNWIEFEELWNKIIGKIWKIMASSLTACCLHILTREKAFCVHVSKSTMYVFSSIFITLIINSGSNNLRKKEFVNEESMIVIY